MKETQKKRDERKQRSASPKTKTHTGMSFGECKCGEVFKLKRKTKHKKKTLKNVICPKCGTPKKKEVENADKSV
jgi:predicted SprT family Zn-dependent metalloprotease